MSVFKKIGHTIKQNLETAHVAIQKVAHDPKRLVLGVEPLSTGVWNKALGRNDQPIVNQFGGPTKSTLNDVNANDFNRGLFKVADAVAAYYGGTGAANGLGAAGGTTAGTTAGTTTGAGGGSSFTQLLKNPDFLRGVGGLAGAGLDYFGAKKGADAERDANRAALDEIRRQYDQNRDDLAPWRQTGGSALTRLASLYGINPDGTTGTPDYSAFMNSPDYLFARQEALKATQGSAAARGGLLSGRAQMALEDRAGGLATQNLGNYANRLAAIAGLGQSATSQTVDAGANASTNAANLIVQGGNTRASGVQGRYGAIGAGLGSVGGALSNYYSNRNRKPNLQDWWNQTYGVGG